MGKEIKFYCDICGQELEGYGYYHDAIKVNIKIETHSLNNVAKLEIDDEQNFYICMKHLKDFKDLLKSFWRDIK